MPLIRLLPAQLSLLLLAAHFYRAGLAALVPLCLGLVALSFIRLAWVPAVIGVALALASGEWLRTLIALARERIAAGDPYARLAAILLAVALLSLLAALAIWSPPVRRWYAAKPGD